MITPVPAVMVSTMTMTVNQLSLCSSGSWQPWKRRPGVRARHERGRLQDRQSDGQEPGVLGDLGLARLALLLQRLQPRDDHGEQLQDDAGGDVGHDAQREDRELQQCPTGEQVDEVVQIRVLTRRGLLETAVQRSDVDARRRHDRTHSEDHDDEEHEQDLPAQVRSLERVGKGA
jgi:hypothetical protein